AGGNESSVQRNSNYTGGEANLSGMHQTSPFSSMYNEDGSIRWYPHGYIGGQNPLINYYGQDRLRKVSNLFAAMFAEVQLPFGFTFRSSFQPRIQDTKDYNYWSPQ